MPTPSRWVHSWFSFGFPSQQVGLTLLTLALFAITGCTHVAKINVTPTPLAASGSPGKLPVRAALVIDPAFKDFKYEYSTMGDKFIFPFGASLDQYARNVVSHAFSQVTVHPSAEAAANSADAILIPKALKSDQSIGGVWAWNDRSFSLIVEWTLKDARNQTVLWVKPIEGKATNNMGNAFTAGSNEKILFQKLFDNLSTNTFDAFQKSSEIKRLSPAAPPQ